MTAPASELPKPKSFVIAALQLGAGTALPFAVGWSFFFALSQGEPFIEVLIPFGLLGGLFFGLFFGLVMGSMIKGETAIIDFDDREDFVDRLDAAMKKLKYNPHSRTKNVYTYKPSLQAGKAAGEIAVQVEEEQALIVGARMHVKKLVKDLSSE